MFKRYAYYEKSSTGWGLVVYHDSKPGKSVGSADPERVGPYEVPQEMIDVDGSPNLGLIEKAFPKPAGVTYSDPPIILNQEEEIEEPLPDWAKERAPEGKLSPMQQLFTKNGALRGNATYVAQAPSAYVKEETIHLVVTDANNWIRYTTEELMDAYEPGPFILLTFPNPLSLEDWNVSQRQTQG